MAKRFQDQVQIGQIDTSSGARGFLSLSDRLEGFKQQQFAATDRAISVAQEEKRIKTNEEIKHQKALRDGHIASINNDNRESVARIEAENPDNLIGFNESAEGYRRGVLKGVDPSLRLIVEQDLDNKITSARIKVQGKAIKRQKDQANTDLLTNFESASNAAFRDMRNGDKNSASVNLQEAMASIDAWAQANPDQKEKAAGMRRDVERETAEQGFRKGFEDISDTQGLDAAFDELDKRAKKVPRGWTPDEWDSYTQDQQAVLNRKASKQKEANKEAAIQLKKTASVERGSLFSSTDIPADPAKGSQDRKDVNAFYEETSKEWATLPIQEQIDNHVEFISNTGIVPDLVISTINATMRSGNTDQTALSADLIGRLEELPNSANVLRDIPDESRALSKQIADSVRSGIDKDVAIEIARKNTYGLTTQQKEAIRIGTQQFSKELPEFLKTQVDKAFDPGVIFGGGRFFPSEPDIPVSMQADYNVAFNSFMTLTNGNPDQAKELAFGSLRKKWAVTDVGGDNRFMKNAPEAFYAVEGFNNSWIDSQFLEDMELKGVPGAQLGTDFNTGRSDSPSYPILITNPQGVTDIARDEETGLPLRWKPDFKQSPEYQDGIAGPGKEIENAKKKRAKNLERRANFLRRKVNASVFRQQNVFGMGELLDPSTRPEVSDQEAQKQAIINLHSTGKIDTVERKQLMEAYGVTE